MALFDGLVAQDSDRRITLLKQYFLQVGDKACCFEDLKPYLDLEENELLAWTTFLESVPQTFVSLLGPIFYKILTWYWEDDSWRTSTPDQLSQIITLQS